MQISRFTFRLDMEKFAVIVAGGSGTRMGSVLPKQFLLLNGKPILLYAINCFLDSYDDMQVIIVVPAEYASRAREIANMASAPAKLMVIMGGATRFDSVKNGLQAVPADAIVFVHDAVRCLLSVDLIRRCYEGAKEHGNAIPAIQVVDSMRILSEKTSRVIDRDALRSIQTPQTFQARILKKAFEVQYAPGFTDEATVVEADGGKIFLVEGEAGNIKITTKLDLELATLLLRQKNRNS